ncbi:MAG: HNH endonuclease signature motif containing protein [Pseudobdellovibrionaceae bacterium]
MKFSDYGNTESDFGWEIDHINPVSNRGGDDISNLQPLQWKNNRQKSDSTSFWTCAVGGV